VRWIARQPWSSGRVATLGGSYEGFTAVAAAIGTPEVSAVIADGLISDAFAGWPGQRGTQQATGLLWRLQAVERGVDLLESTTYYGEVTNHRPLIDLDVVTLGRQRPTWRSFAANADRNSGFWAARSLIGKMSGQCAPALYLQAANEWSDDPLLAFVDGERAPCKGADRAAQRFVLGAHAHAAGVYDPLSSTPTATLIRAYLDRYLKGDDVDLSSTPKVQYFVTGAERWGSAPAWPPNSDVHVEYLDAGPSLGALSASAPAGESSLRYGFDPAKDDACVDSSKSTLTFVSAPLTAPLDVVGAPTIVARVATSSEDADLIGTLTESSPSGEVVWSSSQRLRMRFRTATTRRERCLSAFPSRCGSCSTRRHTASRAATASCSRSPRPSAGWRRTPA
jgi:hypothetical protein